MSLSETLLHLANRAFELELRSKEDKQAAHALVQATDALRAVEVAIRSAE